MKRRARDLRAARSNTRPWSQWRLRHMWQRPSRITCVRAQLVMPEKTCLVHFKVLPVSTLPSLWHSCSRFFVSGACDRLSTSSKKRNISKYNNACRFVLAVHYTNILGCLAACTLGAPTSHLRSVSGFKPDPSEDFSAETGSSVREVMEQVSPFDHGQNNIELLAFRAHSRCIHRYEYHFW